MSYIEIFCCLPSVLLKVHFLLKAFVLNNTVFLLFYTNIINIIITFQIYY